MRGMKYLSYEERLRELRFFRMEKRRLQGNLRATFQYLKGTYKKGGEEIFIWAYKDRTQGNDTLTEGKVRLDIQDIYDS